MQRVSFCAGGLRFTWVRPPSASSSALRLFNHETRSDEVFILCSFPALLGVLETYSEIVGPNDATDGAYETGRPPPDIDLPANDMVRVQVKPELAEVIYSFDV